MLTRAAVAKAQEDTEGGGGEEDEERIDEAIMDLQVRTKLEDACRACLAPPHTCVRGSMVWVVGCDELILSWRWPPPRRPPNLPQLTDDQQDDFAASVFQIGLRRSSPRVRKACIFVPAVLRSCLQTATGMHRISPRISPLVTPRRRRPPGHHGPHARHPRADDGARQVPPAEVPAARHAVRGRV